MSKPTDLLKLRAGFAIKPGVKPLKRPIVVYGFDSETNIDGKIIVIASSDGTYSLGEPLDDVLEFLTSERFRFSVNFFYNLGFDHNAIFKSVLSDSALDSLCFTGSCSHGKYNFETIKGKMLKIIKNGRVWRFFDIANFYKDGMSGRLVDVYKATFNEEYNKRLDASKLFDCVDDDVIQYCIEDARACARLSENLVYPANKIVPINKFFSGASLAKKILQANLSKPYRFKPNRLQQFAMNAYGGARIEVFQRGGWGFHDNNKLFMYDIRSAYPSVQCDLTGLAGNFTSHEPQYYSDAIHSFFRINVKIEDCLVGPLKYRFGNSIYYPKGECHSLWVDKNEIELLMEYDVKFNIEKAEHDLSRSNEKPYAYLRELYAQRMRYKRSKNQEERQLDFPLKTALASSYGILIERNNMKRFTDFPSVAELSDYDTTTFNNNGVLSACVSDWKCGQFFNPVHACEVTSAIRCKLYRDSERYQEHLIKYATDSMTFDKRIKLDFGDELGQYEDSPSYNQALVIGCGVYSMVSDGKKVNKFRSFDNHNLIDLAVHNGDSPMIEIVKKAPIKLKESRLERFIWFNTFQEKRKMLDINFDHRRVWGGDIPDFKSLMLRSYDSEPLTFQSMERNDKLMLPSMIYAMDKDLIDYHAMEDDTLNARERRQMLEIALIRDNIRL